ncbi:nif-specific transcriptional activator NifA [Vibrio sp. FNV 38]|nr:nif-specific transcriptional activator NifA [Vibrio sp. FNV 38]
MNSLPVITNEILLSTLYRVSCLLNTSLDYRQTLPSIMQLLHEDCYLHGGLVTILDKDKNIMLIESVHAPDCEQSTKLKSITYKQGEGIVGSVMEHGGSIVLPNLGNDPRFADKLAIYDYAKPFICIPMKSFDKKVIGAICAQPNLHNERDLTALHKLLEMVTNLLTVNIQLAHNVTVKQQKLTQERDGLRRKVRKDYGMSSLVGHTKVMREIFDQVRLVSRWDSTILVRGESGTGKELIANAIHYNSPRANQPFIKLNCAALPDNLLESELFGHEKGAFTGAVKQRKGRFELANNGTIFLDEIGETSPSFQAKLLRVLQEKTFDRVGGTEPIMVDVRVIAATNRNLEQEVIDGNFREDIYYRLNVMPIFLPPLRERLDDIPTLAHSILDKLSGIQKRKLTLNEYAFGKLMSHHWPGNVRELENTLERAAVLSPSGDIDASLIKLNQAPSLIIPTATQSPITMVPTHAASGSAQNSGYGGVNLELDENERSRVVNALEQSGWVKAKAARLLNMTPRQIAYRIQTMNIEMKQI